MTLLNETMHLASLENFPGKPDKSPGTPCFILLGPPHLILGLVHHLLVGAVGDGEEVRRHLGTKFCVTLRNSNVDYRVDGVNVAQETERN